MDIGNAIEQLKDSGNRLTVQRQLILENLFLRLSHPTVEELYHAIASVNPSYVSMPTVYNNVRILKETGLIKECYIRHIGITRYDINTTPHHHLVCRACGNISDHDFGSVIPVQASLEKRFRAENYYLEVYGVCHECETIHSNETIEAIVS